MPPRSRILEDNENVGQLQNEQQARNENLPPPPPPVGQQVPVDAAQLLQAVNALIGVVNQQRQDARQDMQIVQANAEAWR